MHRNTLLLVSGLAVIAALLIGLDIGRGLNSSQTSATPTPVVSPTISYISGTTCDTTFEYPNNLRLMESSGSGTVLINMTKPDESIIVICQKNIPETPGNDAQTMTITGSSDDAASTTATLYEDATTSGGVAIEKLLFTHPGTKLDVLIAGSGEAFKHLISSLKIK